MNERRSTSFSPLRLERDKEIFLAHKYLYANCKGNLSMALNTHVRVTREIFLERKRREDQRRVTRHRRAHRCELLTRLAV